MCIIPFFIVKSLLGSNCNVTKPKNSVKSYITDHFFNENGHLEFLLNWDSQYEATWERRNSVIEEANSRFFACKARAMPDRYD